MQRTSFYRLLALFCLAAAVLAGILAAVALGLSHGFEAGAAALCALVFVLPGLLFLRHWQRLASRDLALAHAAAVAEDAGVAEMTALAEKLDVPPADAAKIVRIAIREGRLQGEVDASGRFVAASAHCCGACGRPVPRSAESGRCPSCGKPVAGGG